MAGLTAVSVKEAGEYCKSGLQSSSLGRDEIGPERLTSAGASAQILSCPKAVYVRYRDHVFFKNVQSPAAKAIIREVLGWVKKETDEVMLIECDRPLLQGCGGFNGVVVLKNCIVALIPLNSEYILNAQSTLVKKRVRASAKEAKNSTPKRKEEWQRID